jgi:hypothetical protein
MGTEHEARQEDGFHVANQFLCPDVAATCLWGLLSMAYEPIVASLFRARETVWKLLNGVPHYWIHHLHQKIRRILGRTHDGGTYANT